MGAGWLPDISGNFHYYKNLAFNCLSRKDYIGAGGGLSTLNGCLGEEYLVAISTKLYQQTVNQQTFYQCKHCTMMKDKIINEGEEDEKTIQVKVPTEIPLSKVRVVEMVVPIVESVLLGRSMEKLWFCCECHGENKLRNTVDIIPDTQNPFCVQVVWDMPRQTSGISNRLGFHEVFVKWYWNFLEEINWQEVLYRKEYVSQHGHDMEDRDAFKDKGDQT